MINISEGRDDAVLERLAVASGVSLRDRHSDVVHNRSVFTLINTTPELLHDVRRLITLALDTLDLAHHEGVHPRLGVVDVVPFVALAPEPASAALRLRDATAQWLATSQNVPVFLYGPLGGGERTLPFVRANAFKDLAPDFGPTQADPHHGAVVVGARDVLVAWNLWLRNVSLDDARRLAQLVRQPGVRALGLAVGDEVQVSCNLVNLAQATPSLVYDLVEEHLPKHGIIDRAELVGLIPRSLLEREDPQRWTQLDLSELTTIESRITPRDTTAS
ncbi:MAG TPA: hypothetical protein VIJ86_01185 [Acidimicrobiales bacterium]